MGFSTGTDLFRVDFSVVSKLETQEFILFSVLRKYYGRCFAKKGESPFARFRQI
ncbi:uncharacterized protein METZ01_LOCUS3118 [marine metagenome]|jgi:hypothetical protein|uniref:Uncharacterized protein n=1 Tax=marine metagenome TaxID=408172 RepID=A0A381N874_9ZZZZ